MTTATRPQTQTQPQTQPTTEVATPLDPPAAVTVSREIAAPADRLFALWTEPAAMMRWFGMDGVTNTGCVSEAVEGGAWRMEATGPGGAFSIGGRYLAVEPGRRLVMSWAHTDSAGATGNETEAEILFEPTAGGTRVTVHHRRIRFTPGLFEAGWTQSLGRIAAMAG